MSCPSIYDRSSGSITGVSHYPSHTLPKLFQHRIPPASLWTNRYLPIPAIRLIILRRAEHSVPKIVCFGVGEGGHTSHWLSHQSKVNGTSLLSQSQIEHALLWYSLYPPMKIEAGTWISLSLSPSSLLLSLSLAPPPPLLIKISVLF